MILSEKAKKWISLLATLLVLILFGYFLATNKGSFKEIDKIKPTYSILIVGLILFSLYLNGLILKAFTDPFKIKLKEHFSVSIATSFYNLIAPFKAGMGFRAVYLKKKHNLDYTKFLIGLFGKYLIIFLTASISALLVFILIYYTTGIYSIYTTIIFLLIILICLSCIAFNRTFKKKTPLTKTFNNLVLGWRKMLKYPNLIIKTSLITLLNLLTTSTIILLIFKSINQDINILQSAYYAIMCILSFLVNITPGSLGITEGLYIISGKILNINAEISLLVAIIYRVFTSITLLIAGPIANYILLKKIPKDIYEIPNLEPKTESISEDNEVIQDVENIKSNNKLTPATETITISQDYPDKDDENTSFGI